MQVHVYSATWFGIDDNSFPHRFHQVTASPYSNWFLYLVGVKTKRDTCDSNTISNDTVRAIETSALPSKIWKGINPVRERFRNVTGWPASPQGEVRYKRRREQVYCKQYHEKSGGRSAYFQTKTSPWAPKVPLNSKAQELVFIIDSNPFVSGPHAHKALGYPGWEDKVIIIKYELLNLINSFKGKLCILVCSMQNVCSSFIKLAWTLLSQQSDENALQKLTMTWYVNGFK